MIALGPATLKPKVVLPKLRQPAVQPSDLVKSNGSKATPGKTPPAVKGNVPVPSNFKMTDEDRFGEIANLYRKVTGGAKGLDLNRTSKKLKIRFELCKREGRDFGKSDFIAVFGDITSAAWKAFTGGNSLRSAADLLYCFERYEEHFVATNQNFEYFRDCTEITVVPAPRVMGKFIGNNYKGIFAIHYETTKRVLAYVTDRGFREKLKGRKLQDELKSRYESLKTNNPKQLEKFHRLLAAALFNELYLDALKNKWNAESLKGLHKDPLLSRAFVEKVFKKFAVKGQGGVNGLVFKTFAGFAKGVNNLRAKLGSQAETLLRDVDPNTRQFDEALAMVRQGKSAAKIAKYIKEQCPKIGSGHGQNSGGPAANPINVTIRPPNKPVAAQKPQPASNAGTVVNVAK